MFSGKVAVVTGSTSGIGLGIATALARQGADIVLNGFGDAAEIERIRTGLEAEFGMRVAHDSADLSRGEAVRGLIDRAVTTMGRIDILVNNAGTSKRGPFLQMSDEDWAGDMELKVYGAIRCSRAAIPHMKKQGGGRIINLSTIGGKQPAATSMPTSVSRAAGLALTKALSKELAGDNILVNAVCIGKIKAGQHEKNAAAKGVAVDDFYTDFAKDIPLKRVGEAEEAANVIVFLASSAASYVTGSSINLDGGASGVL